MLKCNKVVVRIIKEFENFIVIHSLKKLKIIRENLIVGSTFTEILG